ncbi:hypothetical protein Tco_1546647 [Tanacetum coccineum]
MLVIKRFRERKKIFRERKLSENFMQRGLIFCKEWSSIYRQENPTVTGGVEFCGGEEDERELFEIGETRADLLEDDIEILRKSERFRREEIRRSVLFRMERMAGPKGNRVKVAEKEETRKFCGSPDDGPIYIRGSPFIFDGRSLEAYEIFQKLMIFQNNLRRLEG